MPSPGVEWREPLHNFWMIVGYDFVHLENLVAILYVIDDVVTIRYITAVEIAVTNRDRGRI